MRKNFTPEQMLYGASSGERNTGGRSMPQAGITEQTFYKWKRRVAGMNRSIATSNRIMSTVRAILNEAVINDWILVNPFSKAKPGELISIAEERKRETILTPLEEQRLLAACSTDTRRHLRALIIAAVDTGARRGELLSCRHHHRAAPADSVAVINSEAVIIRRNG